MVAIVRKDKILSGYNGNLESVIIEKDGIPVKSTNGVFVKITGRYDSEREVQHAALAGEEDILEEVYLVHNDEVMADPRLQKKADYFIKAGVTSRAYSLSRGDYLTFTEDLFAEPVAVGDVLAVKSEGLLGKLAEDAEALIKFQVIEDSGYELHRTAKAFAVKVLR